MTIASRPGLLLAVPGGPPRCPSRVQIEKAFPAPSCEVLATTLPGIGPRAGAGILVETGGGTRLAAGSELAACAGLTPHPAARHLPGWRNPQPPAQTPCSPAAFASLRNPVSEAFCGRERAERKRKNAAPHPPGPPPLRRNSPYLATASLTSPPGPPKPGRRRKVNGHARLPGGVQPGLAAGDEAGCRGLRAWRCQPDRAPWQSRARPHAQNEACRPEDLRPVLPGSARTVLTVAGSDLLWRPICMACAHGTTERHAGTHGGHHRAAAAAAGTPGDLDEPDPRRERRARPTRGHDGAARDRRRQAIRGSGRAGGPG